MLGRRQDGEATQLETIGGLDNARRQQGGRDYMRAEEEWGCRGGKKSMLGILKMKKRDLACWIRVDI